MFAVWLFDITERVNLYAFVFMNILCMSVSYACSSYTIKLTCFWKHNVCMQDAAWTVLVASFLDVTSDWWWTDIFLNESRAHQSRLLVWPHFSFIAAVSIQKHLFDTCLAVLCVLTAGLLYTDVWLIVIWLQSRVESALSWSLMSAELWDLSLLDLNINFSHMPTKQNLWLQNFSVHCFKCFKNTL